MRLIDVNVLIYAHRPHMPQHAEYRGWLEDLIASDEAFGMSDLVLSAVVRIVTHPRVFDDPTPLDKALAFVDGIRERDNCARLTPGDRHWSIFGRLCTVAGAKGGLVTDAYLAALAIESGSEWMTTDRDYARFPGLRWRHPLDT